MATTEVRPADTRRAAVGAEREHRSARGAVLAAFAAYGGLWGPYLALLPEIRRATGAGDAQLGAALLLAAITAVPAMVGAGKLLDRYGRTVIGAAVAVFAVLAPLPAFAGSVSQLTIALALFGIGSGACNVVLVALASATEAGSGVPVMNRAHALFSLGLLACSLATGAALALGAPGRAIAVGLSLLVLAGVLRMRHRVPERVVRAPRRAGRSRRLRGFAAVAAVLAAVAMTVESGVQQWSAVFLSDVLDAPAALSAAAPGVFAAAMATGRAGAHLLAARVTDRTLLLLSGVVSGAGVLVLATATSPVAGLLGTAVVAAGVSVATPTVYGLVGRSAAPAERGAAIGAVASVAGAGLLLGPSVVGWMAELTDLRSGVAVLALGSVAVSVLALRLGRVGAPRVEPAPVPAHGTSAA